MRMFDFKVWLNPFYSLKKSEVVFKLIFLLSATLVFFPVIMTVMGVLVEILTPSQANLLPVDLWFYLIGLLFVIMFIQLFKIDSTLERKNIFNRGFYYLIVFMNFYISFKYLVYYMRHTFHDLD